MIQLKIYTTSRITTKNMTYNKGNKNKRNYITKYGIDKYKNISHNNQRIEACKFCLGSHRITTCSKKASLGNEWKGFD